MKRFTKRNGDYVGAIGSNELADKLKDTIEKAGAPW